MVRVDVEIHTDEEYDRVKEFVRTMPGWVQMDIEGDESDFEGGDPLAQFIVWFDNEKNAMWFKLQIGR